MTRSRFLLALAAVAVGAFVFHRVARAGDEAPKTAAPESAKPATDGKSDGAKTAEAPATKTPSPMHTLMVWVAKQVAPSLECACPSKPEGEKAWRGWFAGGKDVPLATLRDQLVADGWTADRFVTFFQQMAAQHGGDCKDCKGCKDCKDCEKGCEHCHKEGAKTDASPAPAKPAEPASKP